MLLLWFNIWLYNCIIIDVVYCYIYIYVLSYIYKILCTLCVARVICFCETSREEWDVWVLGAFAIQRLTWKRRTQVPQCSTLEKHATPHESSPKEWILYRWNPAARVIPSSPASSSSCCLPLKVLRFLLSWSVASLVQAEAEALPHRGRAPWNGSGAMMELVVCGRSMKWGVPAK